MTPSSLIQLVGILYLALFSCSGGSTNATKSITIYCVVLPSRMNNVCESYNFTEKNTLQHYMKNKSKYFRSYETYVFEGGSHTPPHHYNLEISEVTNLTLTGNNLAESSKKAIIECNGREHKFSFINSSNIIIADLIFTSCVRVDTNHIKQRARKGLAVIFFTNGANFSMLRVSVLKCGYVAFFIENTVGSVIFDSVEIANCSALKNLEYFVSGNTIHYNSSYDSTAISDILIRNSRFIHNVNYLTKVHLSNTSNLRIILECPYVKVSLYNVTMSGNIGGNLAIFIFPTKLNCYSSVEVGNSTLEGGTSLRGAGMAVIFGDILDSNVSHKCAFFRKSVLHVYNTTLTNNVAKGRGSGVFMMYKESLQNTMILVTFEHVNFINNSVECVRDHGCGGGIAFHYYSILATRYLYHGNPQIQVVLNNCSFMSNHVKQFDSGTGVTVIFVKSSHFFQLNNTSIIQNDATGILGISSNIILSQNITILHNRGYNGGGMFLCQTTVIYLKAHTNVTIAHNKALSNGGGICVETDFFESLPILCFFQLGNDSLKTQSLIDTMSVNLYDNYAHFAGHNIFGGSIDYCFMIQLNHINGTKHLREFVFKKVFRVPNNTINYQYSSISSPPVRICLCKNMKPHCNLIPHQLQKFPGETFSIDIVLVGQFNGTVPGTVQASLRSRHSSLKQGEDVQNISSTDCNRANYTIYTRHDHENLRLRVQHVGDISGFEPSLKFNIDVKIKDCPFGFNHTNDIKNSSCDCVRLLNRHSDYVYCDIMNQVVKRSPPAWIGMIEKENGSNMVAFRSYCPFDYCLSLKVDLHATSNSLSQDAQCALNRKGVLCGSCSKGLSVALGTTKCHHCSNYWLLLFIPFALSGIGFLIVMIIFDITVADGTLSGIIFYFNIIGSNLPVFFPEQSGKSFTILTSVLKLVISLINLETGISMCLFDGMDSYIKAWLEFCFPVYLWILAGGFIFLAGGRCSWIVRSNAVKVLATFILLSYTRLLTAITGALQASQVQLEHQEYELRWLADANIMYFRGKHIPLAIFSVIFVFLLLPFALCLLFIQCLQKVSGYKAFSWVDRLKPFFDVYTNQYTSSGRFWTGLLLLSRCVLLFITAVNVTGDPNSLLGSILITVLLLIVVSAVLPAGLYRQRCLNVLEYSSLVNLGILSCLLIIFKNYHVISHIFVSVEIFVFIGVIFHHFTMLKVVQKYSCCKNSKMFQKITSLLHRNKIANGAEDDNNEAYNNIARFPYFVLEDREPLSATDN